MGARLAALVAGNMPKSIPMNVENAHEPSTAHQGTEGEGKLSSKLPMSFDGPNAIPYPSTIPMSPPMAASAIASSRNWIRMNWLGALPDAQYS
jgi:hypothetical protein